MKLPRLTLPYWLDGWRLAVRWRRDAHAAAAELAVVRGQLVELCDQLVTARIEAHRLRSQLGERP